MTTIISGIIAAVCFIAWCWCAANHEKWNNALFEEFISGCLGGFGFGSLTLCINAGETNALLLAVLVGLLGAAGTSIVGMFVATGGRGNCGHDSTNQPIAGHRPGGTHKHW